MKKPVVLFFARGYQAHFYPSIISDKYDAIFVTLTKKEKHIVEEMGGTIQAFSPGMNGAGTEMVIMLPLDTVTLTGDGS